MYSSHITVMIIVLGIAVILPIIVVFLTLRSKIESEKNKKEIILAALEKNADINIEDLVKQMNKPEKLIKEKLLKKLQWGLVTSFLGIGLLATSGYCGFFGGMHQKDLYALGLGGTILFAIGLAFLISYYVGKKMLAKEMEAEEQDMKQK